MIDDLTIIIQGPLNNKSINNLKNYEKYGKVIFSGYDSCDANMLPGSSTLVRNRIPEEPFYNYGNIFLQSLSTLGGLKAADTKYSIKVRSDESYENLQRIIDELSLDDDKIITNNVFFKNHGSYHYHIGDHMMLGKTENLIRMFQGAIEFCYKYKEERYPPPISGDKLGLPFGLMVTEKLLTVLYLQSRGENPTRDNHKELIRKYFGMVRVSEFGRFSCATNGGGMLNITNEEDIIKLQAIRSLDEL